MITISVHIEELAEDGTEVSTTDQRIVNPGFKVATLINFLNHKPRKRIRKDRSDTGREQA